MYRIWRLVVRRMVVREMVAFGEWSPFSCFEDWSFVEWSFGEWSFGDWSFGEWLFGEWTVYLKIITVKYDTLAD
jgi:hypothetical protein